MANKVRIRITPDTRGFREKVIADLESWNKDIKVPIKLDVDEGHYRSVRQRLSHDTLRQKVELEGDDSQVRRMMRDLERRKDLTLKVKTDVDDSTSEGKLRTLLQKRQREMQAWQDAFQKAHPLKMDVEFTKSVSKLNAEYAAMIKRIEEGGKVGVDVHYQSNAWTKLKAQAEAEMKRISQAADTKLRMKPYLEGEEYLKAQMKRLTHQYNDMPVELKAEVTGVREQLAKVAEQVKHNPDAKYQVNVEGDFTKIKHELERFERRHNEYKLDVDAKTALASAHLAYVTRPRTVDIFARFRATDAGKMLSGITYGATGLKGVENQFQRLVKLFDNLDTKVPLFSTLGSIMGTAAAGAVNLSASLGGVAASLVTISKTALALPGAITGMGPALLILRNAWKQLSESEKQGGMNFDIGQNQLKGLFSENGLKVIKTVQPYLANLAATVKGPLFQGFNDIAVAEGRMLTNLLKVVSQTTIIGRLPNTFRNTRDAINQLSPGLSSFAASLVSLGDTTSMYLPRMAGYLSAAADKTAAWVKRAQESGQIVVQMRRAGEQAAYLKNSMASLVGVATGLFGTLAQHQNGLESFSRNLEKANRAVNSVRFQAFLGDALAGAEAAQRQARGSFSAIADNAFNLRSTLVPVFTDMGRVVNAFVTGISRLVGGSGDGIVRFADGVASGMEKADRAIGDSAPMFSQLLRTVGQLSSTFGGTFAYSLKASAPLITVLAQAAEKTAEAFSKLPAPIQAAAGLWVTFGRGGVQAVQALKQGILETVMATLQYKAAMNAAGAASSDTGLRFSSLVKQLINLKAGTGLDSTLGSGLKTMAADSAAAASGLAAVGEKAASTGGRMATLKSVAKGLWAGFGPQLGIAAAFTAVAVAVSDYAGKAQAATERSRELADALKQTKVTAANLQSGLSNTEAAVKKILDTDQDVGKHGWLSDAMSNNLDSVKESLEKLNGVQGLTGMSTARLARVVAEGGHAYDDLQRRLVAVANADTQQIATVGPTITIMGEQGKAANSLTNALDDVRRKLIGQMEAQAQANGYSKDYVSNLLKEGASIQDAYRLTESAAQKKRDLADATKIAADYESQHRQTLIAMQSAQVSYETTLANTGSAMRNVNALSKQGQAIWDGQTRSINLTTVAGQQAFTALSGLANVGNSWLNSMIANGQATSQVDAQQKQLTADFIRQAQAAGYTRDQAKALADQYLMTPKQIKTQVELNAEQAKLQLLQYIDLISSTFGPTRNGIAEKKLMIRLTDEGVIKSMDDLDKWRKALDKLPNSQRRSIILSLTENGNIKNPEDIAKWSQALAKMPKGMTAKNVLTIMKNGNVSSPEELGFWLEKLSKLNGKDYKTVMKLIMDGKIDSLAALNDWLNKLDGKDSKAKVDVDKSAFDAKSGEVEKQLDTFNRTKADAKLTATDGASVVAATATRNVDRVNGVRTASLNARDNNASSLGRMVVAAVDRVNGSRWASLNARDNASGPASVAKAALNGFGGTKWATLNADKNPAIGAMAAARAYWQRPIGTTITATAIGLARGAIGGFATGGRIQGPGTDTSDSIPAMLSNNEYVLRAEAVHRLESRYGAGFLDALNESGRLPDSAGVYRAVDQAGMRIARQVAADRSHGPVVVVDDRNTLRVAQGVERLSRDLPGWLAAANAQADPFPERTLRRSL